MTLTAWKYAGGLLIATLLAALSWFHEQDRVRVEQDRLRQEWNKQLKMPRDYGDTTSWSKWSHK